MSNFFKTSFFSVKREKNSLSNFMNGRVCLRFVWDHEKIKTRNFLSFFSFSLFLRNRTKKTTFFLCSVFLIDSCPKKAQNEAARVICSL